MDAETNTHIHLRIQAQDRNKMERRVGRLAGRGTIYVSTQQATSLRTEHFARWEAAHCLLYTCVASQVVYACMYVCVCVYVGQPQGQCAKGTVLTCVPHTMYTHVHIHTYTLQW